MKKSGGYFIININFLLDIFINIKKNKNLNL